jgi:hypothetical protein
MSYLNTLRLHFAGRFFSDPSTVFEAHSATRRAAAN